MGTVNLPNTFVGGTTALASEVNANFDAIVNEVNGGLSAVNLANSSITENKLAADAVTSAKIADNAVVNAALASGAVDTAELVNAAITTAKVANDAITAAKLADFEVTTNSDGTSYRMPNGIQLCWISGDYLSDIDNGTSTGPTDGFTWDFPQAFDSAPIVVSGYGESAGAAAGGVVNQVVTATSMSAEAVGWADATTYPSTLDIFLLAIGTYS